MGVPWVRSVRCGWRGPGHPSSEGCAGMRAQGPRASYRAPRREAVASPARKGTPRRQGAAPPPPSRPPPSPPPPLARALTDEQDGEGDEEQEDVRHHVVERVHEATVVEDALVHPVGGRVVLAAAEGQGHGGAGSGSAPGCGCSWLHAPRARSVPLWPGPRPHPAGPAPPALPRPHPHLLLPLPAAPKGGGRARPSRLRWDREFQLRRPREVLCGGAAWWCRCARTLGHGRRQAGWVGGRP